MTMNLLEKYTAVRKYTEEICKPLKTEDYVVQPIPDVSPPKWHLGHTTWFFETFVLKPYMPGYLDVDPHYRWVFNSYYEALGERVQQPQRAAIARPTLAQVREYRAIVDALVPHVVQGLTA